MERLPDGSFQFAPPRTFPITIGPLTDADAQAVAAILSANTRCDLGGPAPMPAAQAHAALRALLERTGARWRELDEYAERGRWDYVAHIERRRAECPQWHAMEEEQRRSLTDEWHEQAMHRLSESGIDGPQAFLDHPAFAADVLRLSGPDAASPWAARAETADLVLRTYMGAAYHARQVATFQDQNMRGTFPMLEWDGVADSVACARCRRHFGQRFPVARPPRLPLHPGCRCGLTGRNKWALADEAAARERAPGTIPPTA